MIEQKIAPVVSSTDKSGSGCSAADDLGSVLPLQCPGILVIHMIHL